MELINQIKYNRLVNELKLHIKELRCSRNTTFNIDVYSNGFGLIINVSNNTKQIIVNREIITEGLSEDNIFKTVLEVTGKPNYNISWMK